MGFWICHLCSHENSNSVEVCKNIVVKKSDYNSNLSVGVKGVGINTGGQKLDEKQSSCNHNKCKKCQISN